MDSWRLRAGLPGGWLAGAYGPVARCQRSHSLIGRVRHLAEEQGREPLLRHRSPGHSRLQDELPYCGAEYPQLAQILRTDTHSGLGQ